MSWSVWGPAILSALAATGIGGVLLRIVIERSVVHGFERQIEKLKSDLRIKETDINDLKHGALSAASARHLELDKRRIAAAERLWTSTVKQRKFSVAAGFVARLNLPEIAKSVEESEDMRRKMQQLGAAMMGMSGLANLQADGGELPDADRLFVPQSTWAKFEALRSVGSGAVATLAALQSGAPLSILKDATETNEKLIIALPNQADFLRQFPESGGYYLIAELEATILSDLVNFLDASDQHLRAVDVANQIIARANRVEAVKMPNGFPEEFKLDPPHLDGLN